MDQLSPDDGDDGPLPYEIKDRVNVFIERHVAKGDADQYKSEVESYSSYNAFIRAKMRAGDV